MAMKKYLIITGLLFCCVALPAQFFGDTEPAEPDISARVEYDKGQVVFTILVPDDHHITDLKHNFFKVELKENEYMRIDRVIFPKGEPYGDEMAFSGEIVVKAELLSIKEFESPQKLLFTIGYQICQERPSEMCFAPDSQDIEVLAEKPFQQQAVRTDEKKEWIPVAAETAAVDDDRKDDETFFKKIEQLLTRELEKKSLLLFLLAFALGFLTSLTPCVYPVIPIIMGYIGSQAKGSKLKGFYLSLFFVLGLGIVYSLLGLFAAISGSMIGASFQNPIVVIVIASIFIIMGLSLAGLFEIPVPSSIASKVQAGGYKSKIIGSLIIGGVAGIIAAPCAGPVLIAILSWISQTRNLLLGFLVMFVFSLGMGVIFVLVGTFTGIISSLPKGGKWMSAVKYVFAVLLIVGGLLVLGMISPAWLQLRLWGILLIGISIFMGLFKPLADDDVRQKFVKLLVVLVFLWGVMLFFKSFLPADFGKPVPQATETRESLEWIPELEKGKALAEREKKILMIDTYAEWCVACKELDEKTFSEPDVQTKLRKYVLVKLDFTKRNEKNSALRKSLNIIGMPTIIFLGPDGTELKRFSGFRTKKEFLKIINSL
jgi:thiol:disulfide interchange protein DsbD